MQVGCGEKPGTVVALTVRGEDDEEEGCLIACNLHSLCFNSGLKERVEGEKGFLCFFFLKQKRPSRQEFIAILRG